jgi:hypothetical protein
VAELLGRVGAPFYILDLRKAPAAVMNSLKPLLQLGPTEQALELDMSFQLELATAFDIALFMNHVNSAAPK